MRPNRRLLLDAFRSPLPLRTARQNWNVKVQ